MNTLLEALFGVRVQVFKLNRDPDLDLDSFWVLVVETHALMLRNRLNYSHTFGQTSTHQNPNPRISCRQHGKQTISAFIKSGDVIRK